MHIAPKIPIPTASSNPIIIRIFSNFLFNIGYQSGDHFSAG
jgi:hypothetical protein